VSRRAALFPPWEENFSLVKLQATRRTEIAAWASRIGGAGNESASEVRAPNR